MRDARRLAFMLSMAIASLGVVAEGGAVQIELRPVSDIGLVPEATTTASKLTLVDVYSNPGGADELFYAGQGGAESIDDVHATDVGPYTQVAFEVYEPDSTSTYDAEVWIYDNPFGADSDRVALAGPFAATGIASGRQSVTVDLSGGVVGGPDLWVGVQFSSPTAGLLINDVPTVGVSHDLYAEGGRLYWFGGVPVANFAISLRTGSTATDAPSVTLKTPRLLDAHPNPFNPRTTLSFELAGPGRVRIELFDAVGRRVCALLDEERPAGRHRVVWNGQDENGRSVASGVYFARMAAAGQVSMTKLALVR